MGLPLLKGLFHKSGRKKLWPQTSQFFDILGKKNYPAKSEVKGSTERKKNKGSTEVVFKKLPCQIEG